MRISPLLALLLSAPLCAESILVEHASAAKADTLAAESLNRARKLDVLFGHQSVGGNLLDGLAALAEQDAKRYALERRMDPGCCRICLLRDGERLAQLRTDAYGDYKFDNLDPGAYALEIAQADRAEVAIEVQLGESQYLGTTYLK